MKILATTAFFYKESRLKYLQKVLKSQKKLAPQVDSIVLTNTTNATELAQINNLCDTPIQAISITGLPNPWYLTWAHKQIMRERINDDYTHFLYTEDDIELTCANIEYWLHWREPLKELGFYPSFVRIEFSNLLQKWVSTDIEKIISLAASPKLQLSSAQFINLPNPYQGLFFYDRDLIAEHLESSTSNIMATVGWHDNLPATGGGIAERANFALTWENVPEGFYSRNIVRFFEKPCILDPGAFIHHLPNNYANAPEHSLGSIPVLDLLSV